MNEQFEAKILWAKLNNGEYRGDGRGCIYGIRLEPKPIDRYIALQEGHVQKNDAGTPLYFWYLRDAKSHCEELARGCTGFEHNTSKRPSSSRIAMVTRCPNKIQIICAVRAVTGADGRHWPIVDEAKTVLHSTNAALAGSDLDTLTTFAYEIAKWGSIHRWLAKEDYEKTARALWFTRLLIRDLHGRTYHENRVSDGITTVCSALVRSVSEAGVPRQHWSWCSKMLHWLLPHVAPVYDSLVLQHLGIGARGLAAYQQIVEWEYNCALTLIPYEGEITGAIREMTLLAAIDNYIWHTEKTRSR